MLLDDRTVVIYGGGGAIGGAVARACGREGARVFVAGRSRAKLEAVVADIVAAGGRAQAAEVDALDGAAVDAHAAAVAAETGGIDVGFNAVGFVHVQGVGFAELTVEEYLHPISVYARCNFVTAQAVARHMGGGRGGVILTITTPGSIMAGTGYLGNGAASAAVEAMSRLLACDLAPRGIRVVCLRPHATPETLDHGSHARDVFGSVATRVGISLEQMMQGAATATPLKRLPTLAQIARTAVFVASDDAAAMTGAIVNLTCGVLLD